MDNIEKKSSFTSLFHTGNFISQNGMMYEEIIKCEIKVAPKLTKQYQKAQEITKALDNLWRDRLKRKEIRIKEGYKNERI